YLAIKDLYSLTLIGYFFNNFMPTSIGGDLVKGYYISKNIKSKLFSYASVFVDRAVGMLSLIFIASVALIITGEDIKHRFIFWTIGLLLLFCLVGILVLLNKKLLKKISTSLGLVRLLSLLKLDSLTQKAYDAMNIYTNHKRKIFKMFVLSVVAQVVSFCTVYLLAISLGVHIPFIKIMLIMPIIAILLMLPITFNGLGLREWSFVFFFSPNIGDVAALSLSLLFFAIYLLVSAIGGILYLFRR
ncbi:MAG: flippase-like domain-containing protein, partial [Omnitrophica bacterium]|nr:flippase-like domain-containing protein [Candidatus Omnitrophota bacterium]